MNMTTRLFGATAAAVLMSTAPVLAATVLIDDFTISQEAKSAPVVPGEDSTTIAFAAGGPLGAGTRTLTAVNTASNGFPAGATSIQSIGGVLSYSNNDQATGSGSVTYTGLGDLTLGGAGAFFLFDVGVFDNVANFTATAEDGSGVISTYTEVLAPGFDPELYFTSFVGGSDFTDNVSLTFEIDTTLVPGFGPVPRVDGSLNSISISMVPVPAAGLMLFGALGGVAALRRRKDRKAA